MIIRITIVFSIYIILQLLFPKNVTAQTILFEDHFNNGLTKWESYRGGISDWVITPDGMAGTNIPTRGTVREIVPKDGFWNNDWGNYTVEYDFIAKSGVDKNFTFRVIDFSHWYEFHHSIAGAINLTKIYPGEGGILTSGNFLIKNNLLHHIKISADDDDIKLCITPEGQSENCVIIYTDSNTSLVTGKMSLRVGTGSIFPTEIYFDNVVVKSIGPAPPPPPPTQKVVVLPGLGGSWNTEAILSCEPGDNNDGWTLSPIIAGDVYNPLMNKLVDERWEVHPYYYDWRRNVMDNSNDLDSFIENIGGLESNEKVHLIGHSMGGLVGRGYVEEKTEEENRAEKLLTAGSPHKGAATAYPAWSAGQIWNDNFLMKIAITTLVKHCGLKGKYKNDRETVRAMAPSLEDLLPAYEFLKDRKTYSLKPLEEMEVQNTWLLNDNFNPPFNGTEVGTLSGNSFKTLYQITYKNRNKHDEQVGNWSDGKPAGKEFSLEGDETVLLMSSNLEDATFQESINKDHLNLVASNVGIEKILEFLGPYPFILSSSETSSFTEPESALLIIGHPADFIVNSPHGKIKKDKDGVVVFLNPKKGKYLLSLVPKSQDSLLIVGQFLKNGNVLWKEYKLKNKLPKTNIINFEPDNPFEDPVF